MVARGDAQLGTVDPCFVEPQRCLGRGFCQWSNARGIRCCMFTREGGDDMELQQIYQKTIDGDGSAVQDLVEKATNRGARPSEVLYDYLIPAMG